MSREDPEVQFDLNDQDAFIPVSPERLAIARLARRPGRSDSESTLSKSGQTCIQVALYRDALGQFELHASFRLKLHVLRALKRSHKRALIEVDDIERPAGSVGDFEVRAEPADAKQLARLKRVVARALLGGGLYMREA
jgi:hypothetical protein